MMDIKGIGGRIQRLFHDKGMTRQQVADHQDMSVNDLSNIERGQCAFTP